MKLLWKRTLCVLVTCILIVSFSGCDATTGDSSAMKEKRYERFVQVDESLICPDYDLGVHMFLSDGSTRQESYDACYLVDRVSRYVYIYMYETGSYDSGMMIFECKDADGNHMKYTGELPN